MQTVTWLTKPQKHDYPAAASYLTLLYSDRRVAKLVRALRKAPVRSFKAKDIFRASGLSRLGVSNQHVRADQRKIRARVPLSPLLLVRDRKHGRVVIADGYHRLCAVYSFHEDVEIPCQIAS
jgi:hypothetical protein